MHAVALRNKRRRDCASGAGEGDRVALEELLRRRRALMMVSDKKRRRQLHYLMLSQVLPRVVICPL